MGKKNVGNQMMIDTITGGVEVNLGAEGVRKIITSDFLTYATPQDYGAKGDGIADDTNAIKQCIENNLSVRLYGNYLITDYLEIRAGQKIYADNATVSRNVTNSSTFIANNSDGWQIDGKLEIIGAGKANGMASAINIVGCRRFDVRGVTIRNMAGYGINIQSGSDPLPRGEGGLIINCWLIDNWYGIETKAGAEGEYNCIMNCNFTGNNTAMSVNAGNTSVIGGNIVDNNIGLFIGGDLSTNGAHGIVSGVNINHNVLNLFCYNVESNTVNVVLALLNTFTAVSFPCVAKSCTLITFRLLTGSAVIDTGDVKTFSPLILF